MGRFMGILLVLGVLGASACDGDGGGSEAPDLVAEDRVQVDGGTDIGRGPSEIETPQLADDGAGAQAEQIAATFELALALNVDLGAYGIELEYGWVPPGLHPEPIIIDFGDMLTEMTQGALQLTAVNSYTVGNFEKYLPDYLPDVSNMLDPHSKFKDTWFGVYFLFDDAEGNGRDFILLDPAGDPADLANIAPDTAKRVPELDQKLISWNSHADQEDYSLEQFEAEFTFEVVEQTDPRVVTDMHGREWLEMYAEAATTAALTDVALADMPLLGSFRSLVGLPNDAVYALVDPWHAFHIKGKVAVSYYTCGETSFWAIAYYNGSVFDRKDGVHRDTWTDTDLPLILQKMFDNVHLVCAE